jgi:hypothetical protein
MEAYERQQFDLLLQTAVERYVERLQHRNGGADRALEMLRRDRQGEGVWLDRFVDAVFEDFLLNNNGGTIFILRALGSRLSPDISPEPGQTVDHVMMKMAKAVFTELFFQKTEESLEHLASFLELRVTD